MINSSLVSAQNRVRLYWTNIPNIKQPQQINIMLSDILQPTKDLHSSVFLDNSIRADTFKNYVMLKNSKITPA